ncbi:MAG: 3,4-dihydroxyphenylacetate 2,3-dioxygenase [Chloroflexota bacterium]
MGIPTLNHTPPFNIVRISHLEWGMSDLGYAKEFYVDLLGYILEEETSHALYLRGMEEVNHHSLVLTKSDDPSVQRIAFKVASEDDLDKAEGYFSERGNETTWVEKYAQGRTLHVNDPFGMPLEFYYEMEHRPLLLQKYTLYSGAKIQRIDHINVFSHDVQSMVGYYVSELGFRPTEITLSDVDDTDSDMWAVWVHRKGGVHDIAFTNGLGPRMHHIGVYVPTATDIIDFCDRLASSQHKYAFERGPGRHGISNAFFLYILDKEGHRVELFASDYMTVDPDHPPRLWGLQDPQRQTLWGTPAPRSWFEEGSLFAGLEPKHSDLIGQPIVAPD